MSAAEISNVCSLAFPDSHCAVLGDIHFAFRIRSAAQRPLIASHSLAQFKSKRTRSAIRFVTSATTLFGFVSFRQRKDDTNARGYFQKSTVILTPLPSIALFESVVSIIGSAYHDFGPAIVGHACTQIAAWPPPHPGQRMQLPLLGHLLNEQMPNYAQLSPTAADSRDTLTLPANAAQSGAHKAPSAFTFSSLTRSHTPNQYPRSETDSPSNITSVPTPSAQSLTHLFAHIHNANGGLFHTVNLYSALGQETHNLWYLWELIITGEPLLVLAKTPALCSNIVLALVSMITPIIYRGDYRPYFTIYDPDFKHYTKLHDLDAATLPAVVLGVTNPFFLKALAKWPHVLCFGDAHNRTLFDDGGSGPNSPTSQTSTSASASKRRLTHKIVRAFDGADTGKLSAGHSQLLSHNQPLLTPDEAIIKRLMDEPQPLSAPASPRSAANGVEMLSVDTLTQQSDSAKHIHEINNAVLRKTFRELTETFLSPFLPFIIFTPEQQKIFSSSRDWNPYLNPPKLPPFKEDEFLLTLGTLASDDLKMFPLSGLKSTRRAKLVELYRRFVRSPHFLPWFNEMRSNGEALIDSVIVSGIRRLAAEAESALIEKDIQRDINSAHIMYRKAQQYFEKTVTAPAGPDVHLCSALLLHMAMIKRAVAHVSSVVKSIEVLDSEKAYIIDKFAKNARSPLRQATNKQAPSPLVAATTSDSGIVESLRNK